VTIDEPIQLQCTGARDLDVEAGVRAVNAYIEAGVRARPGEWFWVHKRWPQEAYAELSRADAESKAKFTRRGG
jgi:KDO2-lipid IV(A) lauroyltransferase